MTLPNRHTPRILVVGDLMIDHYLWGATDRISPEAPVPVVDVAREMVSPGGAGNVMSNLLALGTRVFAASAVGSDPTGRQVIKMLRQQGVETSGIIVDRGRQTSRKTRLLATGQQVVRFDRETKLPISEQAESALLAAIEAIEPRPEVVLLSDYAKGVCTESLTRSVVAWARRQGIPVLVDPKGSQFGKYQGATLITPNRKEAALATGIAILDDSSLRAAGEQLRRELELDYALITLSEDGMALFGQTMTRIEATAREVYDVTGAGDTVLAVMGFALASGVSIPEAAQLANRAAAVVVGKLGSATVTLDEILAYSPDQQSEPAEVIQPFDAIEEVVKRLRGQGKRVVFTNGCFDILHRGHIEYLEASRECGDTLIVGLNSDTSVGRLKGPERPVNHQDDRAHLLAALRCVDHVVVFEEDTPLELIARIRPDVLTKGADYADRPVVGSHLAGEVRLIALVEGRSTSQTIERIRHAA